MGEHTLGRLIPESVLKYIDWAIRNGGTRRKNGLEGEPQCYLILGRAINIAT